MLILALFPHVAEVRGLVLRFVLPTIVSEVSGVLNGNEH